MSEKTVLIIDDEPDTRVYFSSILEDNGYKTIPAETGAEGIKKLNEQIPDLITLDVSMPEMSGVKFYRTIRENDAWKSIPIIIITGVSDDFKNFISSRSKVPPPEGYLSKPVEADDLLALVGELL
ncbi:MAG: response regulator [Candidatus Kapabacteria bacterium]|nr:response regulator [Candidatus Kapabacteria bacterium]